MFTTTSKSHCPWSLDVPIHGKNNFNPSQLEVFMHVYGEFEHISQEKYNKREATWEKIASWVKAKPLT